MASSSSKKRRLSETEEPAIDEITTPQTLDNNVEMENANADNALKPLLPARPLVPGREYITVKRRAGYWVHFREYTEKGMRRSECIYCENKNFASDGNKNGSKNVRNHWLACPANPNAPINNTKTKQTELVFERGDNDGEGKLKGWTLNLNEVREAIVYMIVIDELPFRFVEKPGFQRLMFVTCPSLKIPSRMTIARDCSKLYLSEKFKLKEFLSVSSQRVSFTTNTWTSIQRINYMCLTAHFIDNEWNLHKKVISFCPIYSHKGKDIAASLDSCFKSWGLEDKVFTMTVDNASSNDVACGELKRLYQKKQNVVAKGNYLHVRCMAHIINLIVWDGLKKNKKSICKIRYAVKFFLGSPARKQFFKDVASKYTKCQLELSLDVPTRWNSTFTMLETALNYREVFGEVNVPINPVPDELDPELDDVDEFGKPIVSEPDHSSAPSEYDWDVAEAFVKFLREFKVLTDNVSGSLYVTSNSSIFYIARALKQLKSWLNSDDEELKKMASLMQEKFDKYWGDFEKMNVLVYMGAILDPKVKLLGLKLTFTRVYGSPKGEELTDLVYRKASALFDEYMRLYASESSSNDHSTHVENSEFGEDDLLDFKKAIEKQVQRTRSDGGYAKSEFDRYLNEVLGQHELSCNVLTWWKLNGHRYPILARLARDVLAMPISTVASESTFSAGRRHLSAFRSSLTPKIVEALLCTQDWIRPRKDRGLNMEEKLQDLERLEKDLENTTIIDEDHPDVVIL